MTKPTHFFLGLLSSLFSPYRTTDIQKEPVEPSMERRVQGIALENPIPSATPTLEDNSSHAGHISFAFRYGAAMSRKW